MADKGIIFSAPMVRALLDGRKTQTRRLATFVQPDGEHYNLRGNGGGVIGATESIVRVYGPDYSPYAPGDRLYVREAWGTWGIFDDLAPSKLTGKEGVAYVADYSDPRGEIFGRLRPSIHMPRWASRLTLLVTDVRVQRVAEISSEDAIAEGCPGVLGQNPDFPDEWDPSPQEEFRDLWNSLHTKPGERWEDNPWIVAVTFDVRHANIDQITNEGAGAANNRSGDIQR